MLNKKKYAKEIVKIACNRQKLAISNGKLTACNGLSCKDCDLFGIHGECRKQKIQEWANAEYVEPPVDWSKVAIDTPILVRESESHEWSKRYFAKCENEMVYAWDRGATSWSTNFMSRWRCAKLAESEGADD